MKQRLLGKYLLPLLTTAFVVVAGGTSFIAIADDNTGGASGSEFTDETKTTPSPSVEIGSSEDGKTLVITASGDLSDYSGEVTKKVFSSEAVNNVFTDNNGTSVTEGSDFDKTESGTKYYYKNEVKYEPKSIQDLKDGKYIYDYYVNGSWDAGFTNGSFTNVYQKKSDGSYAQMNGYYTVELSENSSEGNGASWYYIKNDDGTYTNITLEEFKQKYYHVASISFKAAGNNLYISTDGTTENATLSGKDEVHTVAEGESYYIATISYGEITNKDKFFDEHSTYLKDVSAGSKSFVAIINDELASGKFTSVKFVKAGDDITISLDQMKSIIGYNGNNSLQNATSLVDFSEVGTISGLTAAEVPNPNYVSVKLPNSLSDADAKAIADVQKNGNWYWLSDDGAFLNIEGLSPDKFNATASALNSKDVKSIVVMGKINSGLTAKNLKKLDVEGIDNLDLHTITNTDNYSVSLGNPFDIFNGFTNLKRVVLPGGNDINSLNEPTGYESTVQVFQSLPFATDYSGAQTKEHVLQTRVMQANALAGMSHFTPEDFKNAVEFAFSGKVGCNDLDWFSGVECKKLNLTNINLVDETFTDKTKFGALEGIENNNVEYLALPDAGMDTTSTLFTTLKTNIPNLKGVSYFNDTTFTAKTWEDRGGICILTAMMGSKLYASSNKSKVKFIRISGPVNAEDLGKESTTVDANGHLTFVDSKTCVQADDVDPLYQRTLALSTDPEKGYARSHGAFSYANLSKADLSGAEIDEKYPNDLCLGLLACYGGCDSIAIPNTGKEIPCGTFANFGLLKSLCIPESYEVIRGGAFQNVNSLQQITTTKNGELLSEGDSTMVISSNMKLIETGAFSNVEHIHDVYCLGAEAPQAERWAFNTTMTYGNSGFSPSPAITRANYINGGKPISVLHFPTECTPDQVKQYTDPTREYSITDGQGTTDGNGKYLVWPNQSEFIRAYTQGHTGYTWKAWNPQRAEYNNGLMYNLLEGLQGHQTQADSLWKQNGSPLNKKFYDSTDKTSSQKDYRGWHEFALVAAYNYEAPDPIYNFGSIRDNNWWTLCLPFDMTKKNLRLVFGNPDGGSDISKAADYPRICELTGVERNVDEQTIILQFGKDLVMNTSETDATVPDEDAVIMKAGLPYLIKPKMKDADGVAENPWNPSKHILKYSQIGTDFADLVDSYGADGVGGVLRDNISKVRVVAATQKGETKESDTYYYRFIGTFGQWYIPQYSYYLGWYNNGPAWWWKSSVTATVRQWAPNTCIMLVKKNSDEAPQFVTSAGVQEVAHWNVTSSNFEFCDDDTFAEVTTSGSKRAGMMFDFVGDSGSTTGISKVVIDTSKADPSSVSPIYNLNGQMVRHNGDMTGLSKGIYIQNGKKFVVK